MKTLISIVLLIFACLFHEGDAEITGWTTPNINGAADGNGILSVDENQTLSTTIVTYDANTNNATVNYTLVTAVSPFDMASTGELTITAALDFETTQSYTLEIQAVDDALESGTATITVTVTDINEADPVFATTYSPCIVDGSTQDTTLITVDATDADTANNITYFITNGNTGAAFTIDGSSGVIQVASGITLDKTTTASYDLEIEAKDDGTPVRTTTTTVSVTVADSCENEITGWTTPTITGAANGTGILTVAEDQALNTMIETYVATTDATSITYSLVSPVSPFDMATNGDLTITDALDFETTQTYTLEIKAVDNAAGTPGSGTATITVTVTDVNEAGVNEADPVFSTTYSPCIADGSTQDTTLTTVAATDADTDENITYSIKGTGNTGTAFKIDTNSGLIQVNTGITLDKSATASYDLEVEAEDDGTPVRTTTTTVSVTVTDSCENGAVSVAVSMMTLFCHFCYHALITT